jgi:N-acetylglucosamine kinase-like BadF-type ATPase
VTPAVVAVDAGQTEIRAALGAAGRGPAAPRGVVTQPGVRRMGERAGPDEVAQALVAAVRRLGPLPDPAPALGVGLSGFEAAGEDDLRRVAELLRGELAVQELALASDGLTSLLGALGDRDGAVVAAGTGTVCVARRGERLVKVDGWGSLLGDAGSGFAIGREGLDLALRHADGRGGSEQLLRAAERRYAPLPDLCQHIYGAPAPNRAVAAFAEDVARAAESGDEHARAIVERAAGELALTACAALARLFEPGERTLVSYVGNVFRAGPLLVEPFTRSVLERRTGTSVSPPAGNSLAGAARLAGLVGELRAEPGILWTAR